MLHIKNHRSNAEWLESILCIRTSNLPSYCGSFSIDVAYNREKDVRFPGFFSDDDSAYYVCTITKYSDDWL